MEKNENTKYILLQAILDKNWILRNKKQNELLLNADDEQMIFDCMIEYSNKINQKTLLDIKKQVEKFPVKFCNIHPVMKLINESLNP